MRAFWSHRSSLAVVALVLMALGYAATIIAGDYGARRDGLADQVQQAAEGFRTATEAYFATYQAVSAAVAETECVRSAGRSECAGLFSRLNHRFDQILNFAAIGADGRFFASGQPFPPSGPPDASAQPFFQALAAGNRPLYVMDPHKGPVSGEMVTGLVLPLRDASGAFAGVVGVSMKFVELERIWQNVHPADRVGILVFDRRHSIIFASSEAETIGLLPPEEKRRLHQSLAAGRGTFRSGDRGWIFAAQPVAGNDWTAVAVHPGPYDMAGYLRDSGVLFRLVLPTVVLGLVGLVISFRDWRRMFDLEAMVMERTSALVQANADLERTNRDLAATVAELETFGWVASHDLREPLRSVSTYVTLLERRYADRLDDDGRAFVTYARQGAQRMNGLVLGLLEYVSVGRGRERAEPVSVDEALNRIRADLAEPFARLGASLMAEGPFPALVVRPGDFSQLLANLIGNALRYGHVDRPPQVRVGAVAERTGWVFYVADNGIGIAPEYHDKIFTLFQRLDPVGHPGGVGVGLTVCRKIVTLYGGRIWLESEPGRGSRFLFTLPDAVAGDVPWPG